MMAALIGIVDTMFARVDMGSIVEATLQEAPGYGQRFETLRRTVPGLKDIPVEVKGLIDDDGAAIVVACGWVGAADVDLQTAQVASLGLMSTQLLTNTHVLEVFVHEREKEDDLELRALCEDRCRKHALNAFDLIFARERLEERAGQGVRQGAADVGSLPTPAR
jgi:riboflavin synthase